MDAWLRGPHCRAREDELVVFMDAYDVLMQRPAGHLLEAYRRQTQPSPRAPRVIFSADTQCWPFNNNYTIRTRVPWDPDALPVCSRFAARASGPFKYLNSGIFMAPVKDLRDMYSAAQYWNAEVDDQALLALTALQSSHIAWDATAAMFLPLVPSNQYVKRHRRRITERGFCTADYFQNGVPAKVISTGTVPSLLHFNGGSKRQYLTACQTRLFQEFPYPSHGSLWDMDRGVFVNLSTVCNRFT
uniref:PLOD1-3-like GT domain-containing protein n=1 Tax=Eutreptiella gymnastica TaxID=73025 RepID=A0A7S4FRH3_9EUGL